jgi:hypothetical protein
MPDTPPGSELAFHVYAVDGVDVLHLRCCDVRLNLDADHDAVTEAIARHLARVHGYIGTIDDDITLKDLQRRLPAQPER